MLLSISQAAAILGVCAKTLRRWHSSGVFAPVCRTAGGHRRYSIKDIESFMNAGTGKSVIETRETPGGVSPLKAFQGAAIYARVSAIKQKDDLDRQISYLDQKARESGFNGVTVYKDIASGLNDGRNGLKRLIKDAFARKFGTVFISHGDRLARYGTALIHQVLSLLDVEIRVEGTASLEGRDSSSPVNALVSDVLAILTSYSGKLYRLRRNSFS